MDQRLLGAIERFEGRNAPARIIERVGHSGPAIIDPPFMSLISSPPAGPCSFSSTRPSAARIIPLRVAVAV